MNKTIQQFDIFLVNLNPSHGAEQKGFRPCVILQTNAANEVARTFLIAPFTSQKLERIYPYQVKVEASSENGLKSDSKLKLDQIRVIDRSRLSEKLGCLEHFYHELVFGGMDVIFDMKGDFAG